MIDTNVTEHIYIMIPALNPDELLTKYVDKLTELGFSHILLVDDGSNEDKKSIFTDLVDKYEQVELLVHEVNKGKGRALKDGIMYLNENHPDCLGVVTADSDGQHTPEDTYNVAVDLYNNSDCLILGCRDFSGDDVPYKSKKGNNITIGVFKLLYRKHISDTQTGLRGIGRSLFNMFAEIKGERFEYETCMLIDVIREGIEIREVPIKTIYMDNNSETHFRPVVDSVKIYSVIFGRFIKYMLSSLSSAIIDLLIFHLVNELILIKLGISCNIIIATVIARIVSSLYNFFMNRKVVFSAQKGSLSKQFVSYYALVVCQMLCSALLVSLFSGVFKCSSTIIKAVVDTVLFFASYQIQSRWLFKTSSR